MIPVRYNVRSLFVRRTTTVAAAFGMALVVFVLAGSLMLSEGIKRTLVQSGRPDAAIVIRKGSDAELASGIEKAQIPLVTAQPQVKRDAQGNPMAVAEVAVVITHDRTDGGGVSNVGVRGVPDNVMAFRPNVRIVDGRPLRPGTDEVIIGQRVRGRFKGMDLGQSFELKKNRPATVVGVFEDGGSSFESEVWGDLDTVRAAFGREAGVSSIRVLLESPDKFDAFELAVEGDKQLGLEVIREDAYYEKISEGTSIFVSALGITIALFFSIGAIIGAVITMYASISQRQREIGTLRALGFSPFAILTSFLLESVLLALIGGLVGVVAATGLGFVKFSMMNFQSWSEVTFSFTPDPGIMLFALVFGGIMGVCGGFFPAVRAARVSPITAMRGG